MNHVLAGIETVLRNSPAVTRVVPIDRILIWSDINMVPSGFKWPYIIVAESDSPVNNGFSGQREEFLNAAIYICHRSYSKVGAARLIGNAEGENGVNPLSQVILGLLGDDIWKQHALEGFYTGDIPIQCLQITTEPRSEPFTPRGEVASTEWSALRKRIDANYYRYSVREIAV